MVYDDFDEIVLSMLEKNFSLTRLQKLLEENSFLSFFANLSKQNKRAFRVNVNYLQDKRYCSVRSLIKTGDLFGAEMLYDIIPNQLDLFDLYPLFYMLWFLLLYNFQLNHSYD